MPSNHNMGNEQIVNAIQTQKVHINILCKILMNLKFKMSTRENHDELVRILI